MSGVFETAEVLNMNLRLIGETSRLSCCRLRGACLWDGEDKTDGTFKVLLPGGKGLHQLWGRWQHVTVIILVGRTEHGLEVPASLGEPRPRDHVTRLPDGVGRTSLAS